MAGEPLTGKRFVEVTEFKTKKDWAMFIKRIAEEWYVDAEKITLVMDNFKTHTASALYETFEPAEAKRIWDRFEFVDTPKHGSWLNMAAIELHVLNGQCLNRHISTIEKIKIIDLGTLLLTLKAANLGKHYHLLWSMEQRFKSLPFIPSGSQVGQWLPLSKMRPWKFMQRCPCGFPSMYRLQLYRIPHRRYAFSQGEVRLGQGLLYRVFCQRQQEGYNLYGTKPQT